ncbi:hypothetical protein Ahy_B10g100754 [Arachis hypogaea]|uniref:Uncharacterized protein n=1 Tax=Arachis hypogaea TaxID=3818 RepID=A0A444WXL5_ARAHY|nr:hypothetical protein Ahy_B10g100754 [Arachis hypogaea]
MSIIIVLENIKRSFYNLPEKPAETKAAIKRFCSICCQLLLIWIKITRSGLQFRAELIAEVVIQLGRNMNIIKVCQASFLVQAPHFASHNSTCQIERWRVPKNKFLKKQINLGSRRGLQRQEDFQQKFPCAFLENARFQDYAHQIGKRPQTPYVHAMAAIDRREDRPEGYVHQWQKMDAFKATYAHSISPVNSNEYWDKSGQVPYPPKLRDQLDVL